MLNVVQRRMVQTVGIYCFFRNSHRAIPHPTTVKYPFSHYLFKFKYLIALAIFVVAIGFIGEDCICERIKRKQEISVLEGKIAEQQQRFDTDNKTLNSLKNDVEALRTVAREKYYMKQWNEDVFLVEDSKTEEDSLSIASY